MMRLKALHSSEHIWMEESVYRLIARMSRNNRSVGIMYLQEANKLSADRAYEFYEAIIKDEEPLVRDAEPLVFVGSNNPIREPGSSIPSDPVIERLDAIVKVLLRSETALARIEDQGRFK